jgi:outer membrane protein
MTQSSLVSTLAAAATAVLAVMACPLAAQQPAPAAYKIGFVNTERVMRDSRTAQQAQKILEAEFQKRDKEIAAGPPGQIERRRNALNEDISQRRDEALKQFVEKANAAIRRIAEAEKFDLVSAEAAYVAARIDLTDRVIKAIDAGK